ncbi:MULTISPECIES: hypothetical protein [Burkholderia cepacia complex]|uniref:hypothetical protein n=1 Tax=Burkholderia cepacia complex TaxID=87882 RepID=UPI00210B577A|nr:MULTISPECIES: hypothetical protein [Burkholderia cepacia complex]MCQ4564149.1 hypothetical protein [Burkholderia contaminans]MCW3504574.1 hypothetical protein [Burkholderia cenocepacia]MCW3512036.1 hypothetical protein [Burkholderia cenocepacia]MCW3519631.1 hypothetical protein [Burkholderia cenocepacia]MCW3534989.1 hypothetical protein [Burkholderia cenocepacia]
MHSRVSVRRHASRSSFFSRLLPLTLALGATGTSAWISIVAGLERGGTPAECFAWMAVALVVLLAAHLLPALTRGEPRRILIPASLLWLACLVGTGYGHATFFLAAQQHAGAQRAAAVTTPDVAAHTTTTIGRSRDVIAQDQARVTQLLANARAERCLTRCAALGARREALAAQLSALAVEADVAKRRERDADLAAAERQSLRARADMARLDPVTARLAHLLNLSRDGVDLAIALLFGLLLECVACLGWLQGLPRRVATPVAAVAPAVRDESAENPAASTECHATARPVADVPVAEHPPVPPAQDAFAPIEATVERLPAQLAIDTDVLRLANAVAAGHVRTTVADIRRYMRCSQARASQLRRRVLAMADFDAPAVIDSETGDAVAPSRPRLVHSLPARVA